MEIPLEAKKIKVQFNSCDNFCLCHNSILHDDPRRVSRSFGVTNRRHVQLRVASDLMAVNVTVQSK